MSSIKSTAMIELSVFDPLPSQAYCLKVKEMDDEGLEAAVSPYVTHPHSENAYIRNPCMSP